MLDKIRSAGKPLGEYVEDKIYYGVKTGFNEAFIIDGDKRDELIKKDPGSADIIKPFVIGDDVRRYRIDFCERYIILARTGIEISKYPHILDHLSRFQKQLEKRWDKGKFWWELRPCDYYAEFEKPKIVWPEIAKESRFAWEDKKYFYNKTCFIMPSMDFYLLGLLNSKLIWYFLQRTCPVLGDPDKRGRLTQQWVYIRQIPVKVVSPKAANQSYVFIQSKVQEALDLQERLSSLKAESDRVITERQIKAIDRQIDEQVYDLYGLSKEEIAVIEEPAA